MAAKKSNATNETAGNATAAATAATEPAKIETEKTETVKAKAVKTKAKKAESTRSAKEKTTARKAPVKRAAKKAAVTETLILQFGGKEIDTAALMSQVRALWTKEMGNQEDDLKEIKLYVKPEEFAAYYVINGDITGSIAL